MADSFNIDDFTRKLAEQINYRQRKTRDGSHMTPEGVRQSIQEAFKEIEDKRKSDVEGIENEYNQTLSNTQRAIEEISQKIAELQERNEHTSNSSGGDININYNQNVTNNNQGQSSVGVQASQETLRELEEQKRKFTEELSRLTQEKTAKIADINNKAQRQNDATEYKIKSDARNDAYSAVSGGKADWFRQKADNISNFGNGLVNLTGGKGAIGKFGGAISKVSGALGKMAGPIGIAIKAMELFGQVANAVAEGLAKTGEFVNKEQQLQFDRDKKLKELDTALAMEGMSYAKDIRMAEMERDVPYAMAQADIRNKQYVGAAETQVGAITDGINNAAWNAAYKQLDIDLLKSKTENEQQMRSAKAQYAIAERTAENVAVSAKTAAEQISTTVDYTNKSEQNAKDYQQWRRNNPGLATVLGEENVFNNLTPVQLFNQAKDVISGTDTSVNGKATWFKDTMDLAGGDINPITGKDYTKGASYKKSAMAEMYDNQGALSRMIGNMFGLNNAVSKIEDQQMATIQMERTLKAESNKAAIEMEQELNVAKTKHENELHSKEIENITEVKNKNLEMVAEVKKNWMKLAQATEQWTDKFDKSIRETAMRNGIHGTEEQMRGYEKGMMAMYGQLARKWNVDIEEVMQVQSSYAENTGRNYILGGDDYKKSVAIGQYAGDMGVSSAIAAQMELFNTSVADSADLTMEMVNNVEKIGLNGRKYMKDLVKNLKMAEKYQFKGGVKGLMDMAKWAQQTRFNMDSLPNILEKIQGGGLEGNITAAAKLQVLGGKFAMNANPLAMIYEGFNDPKALASRYNDMISDTGYWDKEKGDVTFGMGDQIRIRQLSEVSGQSVEDLMNQRRQSIKGQRMGNLLDNFKDKDQKALVTNKAYFDKDTNSWKVKLLGQDGEVKERDVSDLTVEDLKFLNPQNHNEKIENYWERLLPMVEQLQGEQKGEQADLARRTLDNTLDNYKQRLDIAKTNFENSVNDFVDEIKKCTKKTTENFEGFMSEFLNEDKTKSVAAANEKAVTEATAVATTISEIGVIFAEAKKSLETMTRWEEGQEKGYNAHHRVQESVDRFNAGEDISSAQLMAQRAKAKGRNGFAQARDWVRGLFMSDKDAVAKASDVNDALTSASGTPMAVAASSVTPIHDGTTIAKTDPQDHAIFAKVGGPFDTLFNGVFGRINEIYESLLKPQSEASTSMSTKKMNIADCIREYKKSAREMSLDDSFRAFMGNHSKGARKDTAIEMFERIIGTSPTVSPLPMPQAMPMHFESGQFNPSNATSTNGNTHIDFSNINVTHSGELRLTTPNGQSVDILKELNNTPSFLRDLTKYISEGISRQINGGRGISNGGRMVSF